MTHDDQHLLEALERALHEPARPPHAERIEAIRARAVAGPSEPATVRPRRRWQLIFVAATAALGVFAAGVVLGYRPPDPLREFAQRFGFDLPSAEREAAEEAVDEVVSAIAHGDPGAFVRANRVAKEKVEELKDSDPESHDEIEPERKEWEIRALQLWPCLYDPSCDSPSPSPSPTESPSPSATLPAGVGTTPSS